ncbi:MAG: hypothetical protein PHC40_08320 [Eubacteriales bacterium]|nr:hypothetical protein [Eubacteriales bacterium]
MDSSTMTLDSLKAIKCPAASFLLGAGGRHDRQEQRADLIP